MHFNVNSGSMAVEPNPDQPPDWRNERGFYWSTMRCCICGSAHRTGMEPRFNYVVCEEHSTLTPVQVGEQRQDI
jgi:hypothetical protein